jgi:hypothetical protein
MPKSHGRPRRASVRRDPPAPRGTRVQSLIERILDTPHLAHVIPQLQPEVLHRIIQGCGLEDCADFVALATPGQLARVFDLDLWSARKPGLDEELDADRFGVWLRVLMESGAGVAAAKLAGMDGDVVIAALAQHVRIFDRAAVSPLSADGDESIESRRTSDAVSCEVGQYLVESRHAGAWDVIVDLLMCLDADHPDDFHRLMRGCRRLSNSKPEPDGFHDLLTENEQDMFDLAAAREARREKQGYVSPAQASAFLQMARQARQPGALQPDNPVARAYFRAMTPPSSDAGATPDRACLPAASDSRPAAIDTAEAVAPLMDLLIDSGIVPSPPRALLNRPPDASKPRLARIPIHLRFARESCDAAYSMRSEELAFLANALAAGCSIQARPFTAREASDAAVAVCNLGLENWQPHERQDVDLADDFLVDHDLVSVFQIGWSVLHDEVCLYAAKRLIGVLTELKCEDREIQCGLLALRMQLERHCRAGTPWHARNALDVMAILDMPAWAALLGLIAECPVIHAGLGAAAGTRAVSASAFEFISENSQIASVHAFMESLPVTLRG